MKYAGLLFIVLIMYLVTDPISHYVFRYKLQTFLDSEKTEIALSDITNFDFDNVHFLGPYEMNFKDKNGCLVYVPTMNDESVWAIGLLRNDCKSTVIALSGSNFWFASGKKVGLKRIAHENAKLYKVLQNYNEAADGELYCGGIRACFALKD